jgi:fatty acid-binding protein DegV
MRIKPVLQIKGERLDAFSKARTLAQGKQTMINTIHHDIETLYGGIEKGEVFTYAVHAQVPEAFSVFKKEVEAAFPTLPIEEGQLSLSVCCHIGPGALAMATVKKCKYLK